jgi:single-strand DNA-binding protein
MNSLKNSVRLIGNLGSDPEVKTFEKNRKMARVNLATNETYTNSEGVRLRIHAGITWLHGAKRHPS